MFGRATITLGIGPHSSFTYITVKPALGNHKLIKLKVVAQNKWSLNDGPLTGYCQYCEFVSIVSLSCSG